MTIGRAVSKTMDDVEFLRDCIEQQERRITALESLAHQRGDQLDMIRDILMLNQKIDDCASRATLDNIRDFISMYHESEEEDSGTTG